MTLIRFKATLYDINGWTILRLPKGESAKLSSRSPVMVRGTVNSTAFALPLEPDGDGSHWFKVDEELKQIAGIEAGDTVDVAFEATKDWPEPALPTDFQTALDADTAAYATWLKATPMAHWEWLRWIDSTENPETRAKRINVSCSKLRAGMRRPCCFNRSMCCVPQVSKSGILLGIK